MNIDGVVIFFKIAKITENVWDLSSWNERPQNSNFWGRSPRSPYILCNFCDFWKITTQSTFLQTRWNVVIVLIRPWSLLFQGQLENLMNISIRPQSLHGFRKEQLQWQFSKIKKIELYTLSFRKGTKESVRTNHYTNNNYLFLSSFCWQSHWCTTWQFPFYGIFFTLTWHGRHFAHIRHGCIGF